MSYACIGLDNPKFDLNVGSTLRAAGVYGASMVVISGRRYRKAPTDAMKHHLQIPLLHVADLHDAIPFNCVPVAVEITDRAIPLPEYRHPESLLHLWSRRCHPRQPGTLMVP